MEALFLVYIPLIFALYVFTNEFLHTLHKLPPSPILNLPIIGHLHLLKKPLYRSLAKLSDRYGPILLLHFGSRRVLVVSSAAAAEECFTRNDVVFANRPRLLAGKYLGDNYTSLSWSPYGDNWRNLRKISSIEVLSMHRLQMLHPIRADEVRSMIRALDQASESRRPVDMKAVFFELTMNVMMRMIAGKRYYGGENVEEEEEEEAQRFREIVTESLRVAMSNIEDFIPVLRWLGVGGAEKGLAELHRKRDDFMQELVEGSKKGLGGAGGNGVTEGKAKTMIEMLLELQKNEPEYYTDTMIRSLMRVLLIAGTDTSAGTLEWALSLLLNNPHVLKKAQTEIDNHVGLDRLIDETDIASLPHLRCIINETLRIYPAGPLLLPHESAEQCIVGGYHVPAGTTLLVNVWAIHNDPRNWVDAKEFKPERFEGLDGNRDGFKMMPFGSGRRGCPGEGLAVRMIALGLGSVIQCFDWERVGEELVDMTEGEGLSMPRAQQLMAYCKTRPAVANLVSNLKHMYK